MRRIAQFLKDTLTATAWQRLPASSQEMTLHDVLRICAGSARNDEGAMRNPIALRKVNVCRYRSELDLHDQWRRLDDAPDPAANLTVVLGLDDFLRGDLRELVRRRRPAHRLVIVPCPGHWPGKDSLGDLALASRALGWSTIEVNRDLGRVLESTLKTFAHDEQLLVILPTGAPSCCVA